MPIDLRDMEQMDLQQDMHGVDRWGVAPDSWRNDYWEMGIKKKNKYGLELNGTGDT